MGPVVRSAQGDNRVARGTESTEEGLQLDQEGHGPSPWEGDVSPKEVRKSPVTFWAEAMPGGGKSKQKGLGWDLMEHAGRGGGLASYCRDPANSRAA